MQLIIGTLLKTFANHLLFTKIQRSILINNNKTFLLIVLKIVIILTQLSEVNFVFRWEELFLQPFPRHGGS